MCQYRVRVLWQPQKRIGKNVSVRNNYIIVVTKMCQCSMHVLWRSENCSCTNVSVQNACFVTITKLYRHGCVRAKCIFCDITELHLQRCVSVEYMHFFCDDHKFVPAQTDVSVQSVFSWLSQSCSCKDVWVGDNHISIAASKSCSVKILHHQNLAASESCSVKILQRHNLAASKSTWQQMLPHVFALRKYSIRLQPCKGALCRVTLSARLSCYRRWNLQKRQYLLQKC